jgi:FkbM family methyltransferase
MKFYYGYDDEHYVDITTDIFSKCLKDDGIYIPAGDGERVNIIGFDPYPNILKHIMILDDKGNKYIYTSAKEVTIYFPSISAQLLDTQSPKKWWNLVGKNIEDPIERLNRLQKRLNLHHISFGGGFEMEYPEQLMIMKYVTENDRVLEIGGNIGRTSHIIQTILNNPRNHVIMECDIETAIKLQYNLNQNKYTEVSIETNALSKNRMYLKGGVPRPFEGDVLPEGGIEIPTISYTDICSKYDVDFNVLVADCEGALYYIFNEDPNMLDRIDTVIMENDYTDITHKKSVDNILRSKGFRCVYRERGVPWASWSCCFDYFYEVWKK